MCEVYCVNIMCLKEDVCVWDRMSVSLGASLEISIFYNGSGDYMHETEKRLSVKL